MPDMSEASIYEALGVTPPSEGGQAQEATIADEKETTAPTEEGGKEPEAAEPAQESAENNPSPAPEGAASPPGDGRNDATPSSKGKDQKGDGLTEAQRHENAARRRREEQQQAVNEALAQERERAKGEWTSFFQRAGLKNTMTGQPITSLEEFNAWHKDFQAAKLERDLKAGKLTPEGLKQAIREAVAAQSGDSHTPENGSSGTPAPTEPTQLPAGDHAGSPLRGSQERGMAGASTPSEGEIESASAEKMAAAQARMEAQVAEIHKLDPSISTLSDLLKMPKAAEFYEKVRAGNNLVDAFYLVNREAMAERTAEAARQQAMNATRSKEHLAGSTKSIGTGSIDVPPDTLEQYRFLMPGISDAEIREHYNKNHRK